MDGSRTGIWTPPRQSLPGTVKVDVDWLSGEPPKLIGKPVTGCDSVPLR